MKEGEKKRMFKKPDLPKLMTLLWAGFSAIIFVIMYYLPEAMKTMQNYTNLLFFYLVIMFGMTWNFMTRLHQ